MRRMKKRGEGAMEWGEKGKRVGGGAGKKEVEANEKEDNVKKEQGAVRKQKDRLEEE